MFNNSYNNSDVEIISKHKDGSVVICLENMGKQTVTLTADQAEVVLDLKHDQYNADHKNTRRKVSLDAYDPDNKLISAVGEPLQQLTAEVKTPETIYLDKFDEQEQLSKQEADHQKLMAIYPKLTEPQQLVYNALTNNEEPLKDKELASQLNMSVQNFSNHKQALFKKLKNFGQNSFNF